MHDIIVIGGGPGGYAVAFRAAAHGLDVALVEEDQLGGTCLNRGCIPSKAILHVAGVLDQIQHAGDLGIDVTLNGIGGTGLSAFRDGIVERMRTGLQGLVDKRTGFVPGRGRILEAAGDRKVVEVTHPVDGTRRLESRHVVVATGSMARSVPSLPVDGTVVQTSDEALWFTAAPRRAVIVGAGAIGMEFASMWRPMETEITVVESLDRPLALEDTDASQAVSRAFGKQGITLLTSSTVTGVDVADGTATVTVSSPSGEQRLVADVVLVAVGRAPNTADVGLDDLGVLTESGHVATDEFGQTTERGLWAVGDVRDTLALAHAAFAEGFVVADLIAQRPNVKPVDHVQVPRVTYCTPEVASVGLTEAAAMDRLGPDSVEATTYSLRGNAKAALHGSVGFVKVVSRQGPSGATLGVHVVGPHATDLIAQATLITDWGALPSEVAAVTHPHPTLAESLGEAFMAAAGPLPQPLTQPSTSDPRSRR